MDEKIVKLIENTNLTTQEKYYWKAVLSELNEDQKKELLDLFFQKIKSEGDLAIKQKERLTKLLEKWRSEKI